MNGAIRAVLLAGGLAAWGAAQEAPVWRIGTFNGTSDEFSQQAGAASRTPFVPGTSNPAEDWFAYHPVIPAAAPPRRIRFPLEPDSAKSYRLRVALQIERAGVPAMEVGINGTTQWCHLDGKLDYRMGDSTGGNRTGYAQAEVLVDIPPGLLRSGDNEISLRPVTAAARVVPDAGLHYDALELLAVPGRTARAVKEASVRPTIFYREQDGVFAELVEVLVRAGGAARGAGYVELTVAGRSFRQELKESAGFGEEKCEFWVPEFPGEAFAEVRIGHDGTTESFRQAIRPGKKWSLLLVPHIHLDVGYTDYQAKVGALQARVLGHAMDLMETTPDFRFSTDGAWNVEQFLRTRNAAEADRLVREMRRRRLFVPAQYCCILTGFPTAETLIRSLYPSAKFSREHGTPFDYANLTDVPSHTWSYASILAAAGIRYFFAGSNGDRGPIAMIGRLNERSPLWWEGPDGKKVLLWYARSYGHLQRLCGRPALAEAGREMLPLFLQAYDRPSYPSGTVILYGTQDENRELFPEQAQFVGEWNERYAFPRFAYSGFSEALARIRQELGDAIPTLSGDGGPYWEDGIAANPFHAALTRGTERRGPSAEKLATLATLANPQLTVDKELVDRMWRNLVLYAEHTQVVANSMPAHDSQKTTGQLEVKNFYAVTAGELAKELIHSAGANIAERIAAEPRSVVVFNPVNWTRSGLVTFDLGTGTALVDAVTNRIVPVEVTSRGANFRRVNFMAREVPGLGYKVYRLRAEPRAAAAAVHDATLTLEDVADRERGGTAVAADGEARAATSTTLESRHYRVELDPASGSVRSLYDKALGKELVDQQSPYRFGQYVYVTGGDEKPNGLLQYAKPVPGLEIHPAGGGRLVALHQTPYGHSARLVSTAPHTPRIETEIRVFDEERKVEIVQRVRKNQVYRREGVYFAFPFAMSAPQFQYEIQNGVVDPAKNMLPGAGREWFSVQNWVAVQQDGVSGAVLPLDAPLLTLGDINRGEWPVEFGRRRGTLFSFVLNNYHQPRSVVDFGAEVKHDDLVFRYVVTSAARTDPIALSRLGWGEMTPFEKSEVQPQDSSWERERPLAGDQGRFLRAEDPALVLTAWKPAEDGDGTILRFLDLGGEARTATVDVPLLNIREARLADAVERDRQPLPVAGAHRFSFPIGPREIVTVRLRGAPVLPARVPPRQNTGGAMP